MKSNHGNLINIRSATKLLSKTTENPAKTILDRLDEQEKQLKTIPSYSANYLTLTRLYSKALVQKHFDFRDADDVFIHFPAILDYNGQLVRIYINLTRYI